MRRQLFALAVAGVLVAVVPAPAEAGPARKARAEAKAARAAQTGSASDCAPHPNWPREVTGKPPGFSYGSPTGLYLWQIPDKGWRLRVTHPNPKGTRVRMPFEGRVTSGARMWTSGYRIENEDSAVRSNGHLTTFAFANYGGIDGLNFRMGCGEGFLVDAFLFGERLRPDQVFIGADRHHPPKVPFRINRLGRLGD